MTSNATTTNSSSRSSSHFKIDSLTAPNTRPRQLSTISTTASSSSTSNNNHPWQLPRGTQVLFQSDPLSVYDEALVIGFSLIVFSSVVWVPWAIFKIMYTIGGREIFVATVTAMRRSTRKGRKYFATPYYWW
jgi:hypothetical protein